MGVEPNAWSRALPVLCADLLRHWERDARFLCCQKIHIQFSNAEPGGSAYLPRGAFRNYAAARPGGRVLQRGSKPPGRRGQAPAIQRTAPQRAGGHMGPSLRLKRTTLITGSAPLIRLAFGHPPSPFGLQLFPPDRGNRTSPKGKALRAGLGPAPTADTKRLRFPCRGRSPPGPPGFAPGALAHQSQVQKLNRTSGNFCTPRAQWPGGNSDPSLRFCAPKTLLNFSGGRPP